MHPEKVIETIARDVRRHVYQLRRNAKASRIKEVRAVAVPLKTELEVTLFVLVGWCICRPYAKTCKLLGLLGCECYDSSFWGRILAFQSCFLMLRWMILICKDRPMTSWNWQVQVPTCTS